MNQPEPASLDETQNSLATRLATAERALIARDKTIAALVSREKARAAKRHSVLDVMEENTELQQVVAHKTLELEMQNARLSREIEARNEADAALKAQLKFLKTFLDTIPSPVFIKDTEGVYLDCNKVWADQIMGLPKEEIIGRTGFQLPSAILPDLAKIYHEKDQWLLHHSGLQVYESEVNCADHVCRKFIFTKAVFADAEGAAAGIVGVMLDITERKRLEEQLFESRKMETVGKLAGGVAHEFNSILTAIIGRSELLFGDLPADSPLVEHATEITQSALRAATLTRQLLAYGRRQFLRAEPLDLNRVLKGMDVVLRELLAGKAVDLTVIPAPGLHAVKADASQIELVIMNLVQNACEAMSKGGQLTLATANVTLGPDDVSRFPELKPGDYVRLAVTDTGAGMSAEVKARAFEPFFTTKDIGQGPGLGLSTCHGIIQQSGGHISVASEAGQGTTVEIYLPRLANRTDTKPSPAGPAVLRGGNETILLVGDEPVLRASLRMTLARLGYRVLEAATGNEAVAIWQQHRDKIRLLLTDLVMPGGMNEKELAAQFLQENPRLKVIYTSGYSGEVAGKDLVLEEGVNFMAKPFQSHLLAQTVRKRLDQN